MQRKISRSLLQNCPNGEICIFCAQSGGLKLEKWKDRLIVLCCRIKNSRNFGVLYTVADISSLVEQSNEWIDFADTYFFFKQTSNKNKDFCSELFGEYEREKESVTMRDTKFFFYESKDKTRSLEKERVYPPEIFSGLQDNQAIYYNKTNNEHTFLTVY